MPVSRSSRVLALVLLVLLVAGGVASLELGRGGGVVRVAQVAPVAAVRPVLDRRIEPALVTTTTSSTLPPPPPTTRPAPAPPTPRRVVQPARTLAPAPASGARFWRRLSNCESRYGADEGPYGGYFQMTASSWAGGDGTGGWPHGSWEEQQAVAQRWSTRSNPWGQWPLCWGRALGNDPKYD